MTRSASVGQKRGRVNKVVPPEKRYKIFSNRPKSINDIRDPHPPEQLFAKQSSRVQMKKDIFDVGFSPQDTNFVLSTHKRPISHMFPSSGREQFNFRAAVNSFTGLSCPLASMVQSMKLDQFSKRPRLSPERVWDDLHYKPMRTPDFDRENTNFAARHLVEISSTGTSNAPFYEKPSAFEAALRPNHTTTKLGFSFGAQSSREQNSKFNRLEQIQRPHMQDLMYQPDYTQINPKRFSYVELAKKSERK